MKKLLIAVVGFMLLAGSAFAGVMEVIKSIAHTEQIWVGIATVILLYVMKRIPNEKIYGFVSGFFKKLGIGCTLGLNRYPWTAPFWEKHVEAWVVDLLENTVGAALNGYIEGLRTNNKPE